MRPAPRRDVAVAGACLLFLLSGCQLVFGDFTVEPGDGRATSTLGAACRPDTFRCEGAELERCSDDRKSWLNVAACSDADHCDPTVAACRTCTPGQWACNAEKLESCDPNSHWMPAPPCASAELCTVSGDRSAGSCTTPACDTPGAYDCDGNRLRRCTPSRDAYELVERCGSDALCDAAKADAQASAGGFGTCTPPTCLAGTFACDGAYLERCRDDETGWDAITGCDDATTCNPLAGACTPCAGEDTACSGSELWKCGSNGFAKTATCASPELCNAALGRCDPPECSTPGATRCFFDSALSVTELEVCGNDRRWLARETCLTGALCSETAGACLPPACGSGDVRCLGQIHQTCSGDLTHFTDDQTCAEDQACTPTGCDKACDPSALNPYRCDGALLERCTGGKWETQNRCAAAELCDATAHRCDAPACSPALGGFWCASDTNLKQCVGGNWADFFTCPSGQYCDSDAAVVAGQPTCDPCRALAYTCENGTELHLCSADGTTSTVVAQCPGGCTVSSGNVPTCTQMP